MVRKRLESNLTEITVGSLSLQLGTFVHIKEIRYQKMYCPSKFTMTL